MFDSSQPVAASPLEDQTSSTTPPDRRRRSHLWQLPLRTMMLVLTAVGVWSIVWGNQRAIQRLQVSVQTLRTMARELVVTDPEKITVVHRQTVWFDENQWDLNLPAGRKFRVCVGTREIVALQTPPTVKSRSLPSGRIVIALERKQTADLWKVVVSCDGQEWVVVEEPVDWDPGFAATGGPDFPGCTTLPVDKPVILYHRRFVPRRGRSFVPPPGPAPGVVVWLEPE